MTKQISTVGMHTLHEEKRDIWVSDPSRPKKGYAASVRLYPREFATFQALAGERGMSVSEAAREAAKLSNESLAEGIRRWIAEHNGGPVALHVACQAWLGCLTDAFRPIFAERGYPLPASIVAKIAFPSKGQRGKARGEHFAPTMGADQQTHTIFIHPGETDPVMILNIFTHELCHAAQYVAARTRADAATDEKKAAQAMRQAGGHGKLWKEVAAALDLEKREGWKHEMGGDAWKAWAAPLLEAVGPMPHNPLADAVRAQKKQGTRMLKLEHEECLDGESTTWRMAGSRIAGLRQVRCPCCGAAVDNPHFEGGDDSDPDDTDLAALVAEYHAARKHHNGTQDASNAWEAEHNPGLASFDAAWTPVLDNPHWEPFKDAVVRLRNAEQAIKDATGEAEWPDAERAAGLVDADGWPVPSYSAQRNVVASAHAAVAAPVLCMSAEDIAIADLDAKAASLPPHEPHSMVSANASQCAEFADNAPPVRTIAHAIARRQRFL